MSAAGLLVPGGSGDDLRGHGSHDARRIKQLGDQLKSAAARYAKLHQEAVPELALACAGMLSEPIRDRAARSGLHLRDGPVDPR
jgi:hypothetical protein